MEYFLYVVVNPIGNEEIKGHIFNIKVYYPDDIHYDIEAVSIQQSLLLFLKSHFDKSSFKISKYLFDYIDKRAKDLQFLVMIYAFAWEKMSKILVKHYKYNAITDITVTNKDRQFKITNRNFCYGPINHVIRQILYGPILSCNYILTYKFINPML